jgi:hypothetical protein
MSLSDRRPVPRSHMSHPSTNPEPGPDHEAEIIHLTLVVAPVRQLLSFYDGLLAGEQPDIELLDEAVIKLKALPTIPGRLGRDIALIADGGRGASRNDIVGSLERLRQVPAMNPPGPAAQPRSTSTRKSKPKSHDQSQATLPGMA